MVIGMAAKEDGEGVSQKKEIRESWILRWRLSTKEQAKENGDSAKVKIGMRQQRWKGWRKEVVADGQRQESRKRAREGWQRRFQNVLDVRQDRTHCSFV